MFYEKAYKLDKFGKWMSKMKETDEKNDFGPISNQGCRE